MAEGEPQGVVAWLVGKERVEPHVAEPGVEVDGRDNRFALDLVRHNLEESI